MFGSTESLDDLIFLPSGFYQVNLPSTNMPYDDCWYCILWSDNHTQDDTYYSKTVFAINANNDELWYLRITNSVKGKWTKVSNATPPQEYALPLADGITALQPCTYWKNQFSEVTLGGYTSGSVSDGATIATLPEGFRPDHPVERPATFTANGNRYAGSVFITANGIVSIHTPAAATNVVFAVSFLAKN